MKKLFLLIGLTFFFATSAVSTNDPANVKLLSGKVIDKQTGETLAGVKIQLKGTDTYCYTDLNGSFVLTVAAPNTAVVVVDMVGYEPSVLKAQELSLSSDIVLSPR